MSDLVLANGPPGVAPARPPRLAAFRIGLRAPFQGMRFLMRNPPLWPLSLLPTTIAVLITVGLGTLSVMFLPELIVGITGKGGAWYEVAGVVALQVITAGTGLLLSLVLGLVLAQPLSGPVLEHLVREMDKELGAPAPPKVPLWREIARSATGALLALAFVLPILAILFVVDLFIPFSWIVTFPLKIMVTGLAITWDLLDYPFSVRGWRLGLRFGWVRKNLGAALGFGVSLALMFLIPCVQLLLLPAGALGATWLVRQIETGAHLDPPQ
ncbi:MAG TPA: EI24 domain-containing protein [Polyangiaceae bacterium]|nr:EI24 domain-containing protein [Polyangiaceae bacterium]